VTYFNGARPRQGIEQQIPGGYDEAPAKEGEIIAFPVLGGLCHDYRHAA
jgi:hypothetical protein